MNDQEDLKIARSVLITEAESILKAAEKIDSSFKNAIEILEAPNRKIIVTGIGKSGHLGKKDSCDPLQHRVTFMFSTSGRGSSWRFGYSPNRRPSYFSIEQRINPGASFPCTSIKEKKCTNIRNFRKDRK